MPLLQASLGLAPTQAPSLASAWLIQEVLWTTSATTMAVWSLELHTTIIRLQTRGRCLFSEALRQVSTALRTGLLRGTRPLASLVSAWLLLTLTLLPTHITLLTGIHGRI